MLQPSAAPRRFVIPDGRDNLCPAWRV